MVRIGLLVSRLLAYSICTRHCTAPGQAATICGRTASVERNIALESWGRLEDVHF